MGSNGYVRALSAGTLKGTKVVNRKGEKLGEMEEIMIDVVNGEVSYVVLSFGGLLGIGDKLFAVPWEALEVDEKNEQIVMNVTKERLENAPGFDKNNWPESPNATWLGEVYSYYGYDYEYSA